MDRRHGALQGFVAGVAVIAVACTASVTPSAPEPTAGVIPTLSVAAPSLGIATLTPTPTPSPTPEPTTEPTQKPEPTEEPLPVPTPTPRTVTAPGWTGPRRVGSPADCSEVTAGIDTASRYHVAAECGGTIDYFFSGPGDPWTRTVLSHPAGRADLHPQIAFWGDVVYVAFQRIDPDGGCGGPGADVGVYFRSRSLPDGEWSEATRIGSAGDHLESFRADAATLHATVISGAARFYETLDGSTLHRYPIPDATGPISLRIGTDGRARIAYATAGSLRYAIFSGTAFATSPIGGSIKPDANYDADPVLVLDANNRAHVVWTRYQGAACGDIPVSMYYATNAGGAWKSHLITKDPGDVSLQVDDATGRVHVLVGAESGLQYFTAVSSTAAASGQWTRTRVVTTPWGSPVLRVDPSTGALLVVYSDQGRISVLTRP